CRHTHPAADSFLSVVEKHKLTVDQITEVTAHVHQGAIDVLGTVTNPQTVHQAKFSMGTALALLAIFGRAGVREFDDHWNDPRVIEFRQQVRLILDEEVDRSYPSRWIGKVTVKTSDGRTFHGRIEDPKGDPANTLSRKELEEKAMCLAEYSHGADEAEIKQVFKQIWQLAQLPKVGPLLTSRR
ncbi:MAG: MmgE/PrpD family protein, partial [Acidobacteriaceae bacterium]|nr:MmgE/PrpD family protein [Acidobacteriaceae bacterium]